jgi:hypothetical protein
LGYPSKDLATEIKVKFADDHRGLGGPKTVVEANQEPTANLRPGTGNRETCQKIMKSDQGKKTSEGPCHYIILNAGNQKKFLELSRTIALMVKCVHASR